MFGLLIKLMFQQLITPVDEECRWRRRCTEAKYECAREHEGGAHEGGWYEECPMCEMMNDSEIIPVDCQNWCGEVIPMSLEQYKAYLNRGGDDVEFVECIYCQTGLSELSKCADCLNPFKSNEMMTRIVVHETPCMIIEVHQSVCVPCYMEGGE